MVVIHPQNPSLFFGRCRNEVSKSATSSPGAGAGAGGSRTMAIVDLPRGAARGSSERIEIGDELGDLVLREVEIGHDRARLLGRGVAEPGPEVGIGVVEDGACEHAAAL